MLQIYNNLTKKKEPFHPIKPGEIGIYVCGSTVYDFCHVGNARIWVVFDVVTRYLRFCGYKVNYVRNITDIDDKIIQRANENREGYQELAQRFTQFMHEDAAALGNLEPDVEPLATEHIAQIIAMIEKLIAKGYAYIAANGDVYYDVNKFAEYGALAHQDLAELRSGARVAVAEVKRDPLDFVLWKMSKPGEPAWDSPWGAGRPGWHIECSAMSTHYLGGHFDIHGGGSDLTFPHHQNEIAQAEAANGCKFVNTWMHVGYVQVDKQKMSKSLGNFFTLREVLKQYDAEVIRYFMLISHYRSPVNYTQDNLDGAQKALERFYLALRELPLTTVVSDEELAASEFTTSFNQAMDDDFNTSEAIAVLFAIVHEINKLLKEQKVIEADKYAVILLKLAGILGILQQSAEKFLQAKVAPELKAQIEQLILLRNQARKTKNWSEADEIRDQLIAMGVELEDKADGTSWRL